MTNGRGMKTPFMKVMCGKIEYWKVYYTESLNKHNTHTVGAVRHISNISVTRVTLQIIPWAWVSSASVMGLVLTIWAWSASAVFPRSCWRRRLLIGRRAVIRTAMTWAMLQEHKTPSKNFPCTMTLNRVLEMNLKCLINRYSRHIRHTLWGNRNRCTWNNKNAPLLNESETFSYWSPP